MAEAAEPKVDRRPSADPRASAGLINQTDLLLLLMVLIWGSNFSAIKYSLEDLLPLSFNALRFTIASVVILFVAAIWGGGFKVTPGEGARLFLLGLLGNTCYQTLFITGMSHTRVANAALILATTPLFTAILGRIRKHEFFRPRGVAGLMLAFAGIVIVVVSGRGEVSIGETILGDSLLLASTICWSLYTVGSRNLMHHHGPMKTTAIMMASGTPFLLLICLPSLLKQNWSHVRPVAWAGVVYSGLFAIALAYLIWNYGVRKIGSTRTAIYSNVTPVVALLVAWPALGETPSFGQLAGAAVIFSGIYLVRHGMIAINPAETTDDVLEESALRPGRT